MADPAEMGLTEDQFRALQESAVAFGRAGVDVLPKSAEGKSKTKDELFKTFVSLRKDNPDGDPYELGSKLGLTREDILALIGTSAGNSILRPANEIKDTASARTAQQEFQESKSASRAELSREEQRLTALENILNEEEVSDVMVSQVGTGAVSTVKRFLDRQLEGIMGFEGFAGSQTDISVLDANAVFDVGKVSQLWKGAISNYENQMFRTTANFPSQTPEFIRQNASLGLFGAASATIKNRMVEELRHVMSKSGGQNLEPTSPQFNETAIQIAMEYIVRQAGLRSLTDAPEGSAERVAIAREWAEFAKAGDSGNIIREAIALANATSDPRSGQPLAMSVEDARDPELVGAILGKLADENVLAPASAQRLGGEASAIPDFENDAAVAAWAKTVPVEQRPAKVMVGGVERAVTWNFGSVDEATKWLRSLPSGQAPAYVMVNGKKVSVQ